MNTAGERIHEAELILDAYLTHKLSDHQTHVALQYLQIACNLEDVYRGRFDCTIDGNFVTLEARRILVAKNGGHNAK